MNQAIKVPKEIMELVYEQQAFEALAVYSGFIKAFYYKQKALKAEALIWRTMHKVFPQTAIGVWKINPITGMIGPIMAGAESLVKKPRKPRAVKSTIPAKPADAANSLGE